ncbi:unnamed protein product [Prorocentrum cordatum]|uniref:Uncharacterized protein n=1 Tax=Prorocentrum cordatum TaxID=2364126 RepID=A0ABN9S8Y4_9DINO|nr:unnamed protein product [Polarella glacialis]
MGLRLLGREMEAALAHVVRPLAGHINGHEVNVRARVATTLCHGRDGQERRALRCKLRDLDQQVSAVLEEIKPLPVYIFQAGIPDCSSDRCRRTGWRRGRRRRLLGKSGRSLKPTGIWRTARHGNICKDLK